jgi:hypothetical protein
MPSEIFSKKFKDYFQNNWTRIRATARPKETRVLLLIPSLIKIYVNAENAIMPVANPINLPGHRAPS